MSNNTSDPLVRPCPAPVQDFWSTIASTPSPLAQISQFSTQLQTQQTHYSTQQAQISNVAAPNGTIPWNPADIGFFYPDMPHSWGITEAVVIEEIAYYRTVYAFTNKLRSAAQSRDPKEITQNLYTCFRGEALRWWNDELDRITRAGIILAATIDDWHTELEKRFRLASSQASSLLEYTHYITSGIVNNRHKEDPPEITYSCYHDEGSYVDDCSNDYFDDFIENDYPPDPPPQHIPYMDAAALSGTVPWEPADIGSFYSAMPCSWDTAEAVCTAPRATQLYDDYSDDFTDDELPKDNDSSNESGYMHDCSGDYSDDDYSYTHDELPEDNDSSDDHIDNTEPISAPVFIESQHITDQRIISDLYVQRQLGNKLQMTIDAVNCQSPNTDDPKDISQIPPPRAMRLDEDEQKDGNKLDKNLSTNHSNTQRTVILPFSIRVYDPGGHSCYSSSVLTVPPPPSLFLRLLALFHPSHLYVFPLQYDAWYPTSKLDQARHLIRDHELLHNQKPEA
jgi:hypothetical protein